MTNPTERPEERLPDPFETQHLGVNKVDLIPSCEDEATEEDGLCDGCRCPHGCCENHTIEALCPEKMERFPQKFVTTEEV